MRPVKNAPSFKEALAALTAFKDPAVFAKLAYQFSDGLVNKKYLHWDELLRREPPAGFTHMQWWGALKLARLSNRRPIGLRDTNQKPISFIEALPIPEQLHKIDLRAGGRLEMPEQITTTDERDRYYVNTLIEEAITSSQLEGATTTRQVATTMLRKNRSPRNKSEQMIVNNFLTMRKLAEFKQYPMSKEMLFEIHRTISQGTLDENEDEGRFRQASDNVYVSDEEHTIIYHPPPAEELDSRVQAMCDFANGDSPSGFIHPVIRAIALHFWLAFDHPFVDGNGRTARALFYWCMLKHGYWLFEFVSISNIILKGPAKYYKAFQHTEKDENDLTYFLIHQMDVIDQAIVELHKYLDRKTKQVRQAESMLKNHLDLNHRQKALVAHALRHPQQDYTITSHMTSHDVVYQTARTDLLDLAQRGILIKSQAGKTFVFYPGPNLYTLLDKRA